MSMILRKVLYPVMRNVHFPRGNNDFVRLCSHVQAEGLCRRNSKLLKPQWKHGLDLRTRSMNYSKVSANCSKCGHSVSGFKCSACGALIVPPSFTYFDVLAQSVSYDVCEGELKRIYRQLQSEFHPDKYSQKGNDDKIKSEEISSLINKAYSTLTNPYERGMYLLKLNNHLVNEGDIQTESGFLAEIMERNEELENIATKEELVDFENENEKDILGLSAKVSDAFKTKDYESAKSDLNKMKYFLSIRNRLKEVQRNA